jgi:hypothetical protein
LIAKGKGGEGAPMANESDDELAARLAKLGALYPSGPRAPGGPRALELARDLHGLGIFLLGREVPKGWETAAQKADEIAAILRRAPAPDLDLIERYMREASADARKWVADTDAEDELEEAIAIMRRELTHGDEG